MVNQEINEKIKAYTLKNANEYSGTAVPGSVISSLFHEGVKKEDIKDYIPIVNNAVNWVNSLSSVEQAEELAKLEHLISKRKSRAEDELPELPNVTKTGVVMRFRPAPSGPMHVGHIISNMLCSLFVEKYGGKFYVIIDDTDPKTVLLDAYEKIKENCDWLFGNVTEYINSSDRMPRYYEIAHDLVNKGHAYVCTCSSEYFKNNFVSLMKDCPCRNLIRAKQEARLEKMISNGEGTYNEGEAVLRFKSSMSNKNPAMRDFPLARICLDSHAIQKEKYKLWPLMNLVVSVDDIDFGMTHIIRGADHRTNAERQKLIFKALGKEKQFPWTFFIGRLKFTDLILSKRKINAAISSGDFDSDEDMRLPTVSSLRKRGYAPIQFKKFATQRGLTDVDKIMSGEDFFKLVKSYK